MIYIKNIRDIQEIFIPRTELDSETYIVTNKTYENGFIDGKSAGIELQKSKLTNLVVSDNGLYERENGWNRVEVNVIVDTINTQEKSVTITKDIEEVFPDNGYDALSKVDIDATEFGNKKFTDGHHQGKTEGYEGGKADGIEEGYNQGYEQGYSDGKSESGSCNLIPLYNIPNWEGNNLLYYYPYEYNADGFSSVSIEIGNIYNEGYNDGFQNANNAIVLRDTNIKLGYSTFTEIPENINFEGVTDMSYMFAYCNNLLVARLTGTSSATNMRYMFYECDHLEHVEGFDTANVVDMNYMFYGCNYLHEVPYFNTSNVETMFYMFGSCGIYTIPPFDTSNVTDMSFMFDTCIYLETVPYLNTSNVKKFNGMFRYTPITNIPFLDLFGEGYYGRSCGAMFKYCLNLTEIPPLNFTKVYDIDELFYGCKSLTRIPAINVPNLKFRVRNLFGDEDLLSLTDVGGFNNLKSSIEDDNGFARCPNLTYQSCINILNGLYDFTGNNEEIDHTDQGKLKVHPNFIALVGDQISIATKKGWRITTY